MSVEELVRQYLPKINIMQVATSVNTQPWICTVHFYNDDDLNLYWISTPQRRHSEELKQNPNAAVYILMHENTPTENYISGISIEGTVEFLGQDVDKAITAAYTSKLDKPTNLIPDIMSGKNPHRFYRLKPSNIVMFNTKDFSDNPRQEWSPKT